MEKIALNLTKSQAVELDKLFRDLNAEAVELETEKRDSRLIHNSLYLFQKYTKLRKKWVDGEIGPAYILSALQPDIATLKQDLSKTSDRQGNRDGWQYPSAVHSAKELMQGHLVFLEELKNDCEKTIHSKELKPSDSVTAFIINTNRGDVVLSGNKTEQNGIKGDNNTVGGSIDQHIRTQRKPGKPAKKKFWTLKKIAAIMAFLAGLATIAQYLQNRKANKPQVEESTVLETPSAVSPEEVLPNAEAVK